MFTRQYISVPQARHARQIAEERRNNARNNRFESDLSTSGQRQVRRRPRSRAIRGLITSFFTHFRRVVALESQLVRTGSLSHDEGHDLHILAGHEASY